MKFKPESKIPSCDAVVELIDAAMQSKNKEQPKRKYLGASRIGDGCSRKLAYEYHQFEKDPGADFKGTTLRIFDMGHDGESRMADYLRIAGFELQTHTPDGRQIGISDIDGKFKGHLDGVVQSGPEIPGLKYPMLWENKALGASSFKETVAKGIKDSKPIYYAQVQIYMGYYNLESCLFTCLNRDTAEIFVEVIPFNSRDCQDFIDKIAVIVSTVDPEEIPRSYTDPSDYRCKSMCDFRERCWNRKPVQQDTNRFDFTQPNINTNITPSWLPKK
jgi:hypothetical protein